MRSDHFFPPMVDRKITVEKLDSIADANGFVIGAYEEENRDQQQRDEYSKRWPERTLDFAENMSAML